MKSEGAVRHKLGQVRFRHLKRALEAGLSQSTLNCVSSAELDQSTVPELAICLHPEVSGEGVAFSCTNAHAATCPHYQAVHTKDKDEIKAAFYSRLAGMDRGQIAATYPDMAPLLWVLDAEGMPTDLEDPPEEDLGCVVGPTMYMPPALTPLPMQNATWWQTMMGYLKAMFP